MGTLFFNRYYTSDLKPRNIGVSMMPRAMVFTVTPWAANSTANLRLGRRRLPHQA